MKVEEPAAPPPNVVYYKPLSSTPPPPPPPKTKATPSPVYFKPAPVRSGYKKPQEPFKQTPKEEDSKMANEESPSKKEPYEFGDFAEGSFKIPDFFRNFLSAPPSWINIKPKDWRRRR